MAEHDHLCGLVRFTGSHDLFGGHCSAEVIEAGEGVIEYDDLVRNMGIAFELRQEEGEGKGIFVAGAHRRIEPRIVSASLGHRSEEHTSELQSLMRISYAVFCLKKKTHIIQSDH